MDFPSPGLTLEGNTMDFPAPGLALEGKQMGFPVGGLGLILKYFPLSQFPMVLCIKK